MLDELNPQQREVALTRRPCVAIACPGAGKTKTIAAKAALLLRDPALTVGAVTFSKDAATELLDRILRSAAPDAKGRLTAGTFHSLAFRQLGLGGGARRDIASDGDRTGLLARVLAELGLNWKVEEAIPVIERIKTNFGRVEQGTTEAELYNAYQEALARNGKIDFQDMLRLAVAGMDKGDIKPYAFTDLLVDEFRTPTRCSIAGWSYMPGPARASRWWATTIRVSTGFALRWVIAAWRPSPKRSMPNGLCSAVTIGAAARFWMRPTA